MINYSLYIHYIAPLSLDIFQVFCEIHEILIKKLIYLPIMAFCFLNYLTRLFVYYSALSFQSGNNGYITFQPAKNSQCDTR